jgi:hypothetical protein
MPAENPGWNKGADVGGLDSKIPKVRQSCGQGNKWL